MAPALREILDQDFLRGRPDRKTKSGSHADLGFYPDRAAQPFDDFLANRKTKAGARHIPIHQTYERQEYASLVLWRDADCPEGRLPLLRATGFLRRTALYAHSQRIETFRNQSLFLRPGGRPRLLGRFF